MKKTTPILQEKYARKSLLCQLRFLRRTLLLVALAATFSNYLAAQCQLEAHDINISLDANCENEIFPADFATFSGCPDGEFIVLIYFEGVLVDSGATATITGAYVDETVTLELLDTESGNSTWSYGNVEDKTGPVISCNWPTDTIVCGEDFPPQFDAHAEDNCSGDEVDVILIDEFETELPCDSVLTGLVTRVWIAVDADGNESEQCTMTLSQRRLTEADIDWPDSLLIVSGNPLNCDLNWDTLEADGIPHPNEINSFPLTTLGSNLFPQDMFCNVTTRFEDFDLSYPSDCNQKIMRVWTVSEWWCSERVDYVFQQMIEIADTIPPTIVCPDDFTVSSGVHDCCAEVSLPGIVASDNCQDVSDLRVDVRYPGGFISDFEAGEVIELCGSGTVFTIEYRVFDPCGSMSNCFVDVTLQDINPPTPVCKQELVTSLSLDGLAKVYAESFDNGSNDNCQDVFLKVRRMNILECDGVNGDDNDAVSGIQEYYDDYVKFCCEDVGGDDVMVVLRVFDVDPGEGPVAPSRMTPGGDLFGRFNDCMVNVEVQDKLAPLVTCPPDITVTCTFDFDDNDLSVFGSVVVGEENREEIIIFDADADPDPINWGLDGFTTDNCVANVNEEITKKLDACGLGTIERDFIAVDAGGREAECRQVITIERVNPFDGDDIVWPLDYEAVNMACNSGSLPPESLPFPFDRPQISETECDQVGVDYEDEFFSFTGEEEACFKILRTWKVIDWCGVYEDPSGGTVIPRWEHIQVIKVFNNIAPEFVSGCDSLTISTDDPECSGGFVSLMANAQDDCTSEEDLIYSYQIDAFRDGVFDIFDDGNNASATYPVGRHLIQWTVEDRCGNKETCTQPFTVVNTKKPTPICHGLTTVLMENDGTVEIWASDLDKGSVHSCPGIEITASFDSVDIVSNMTFTCDDLGVNIVQLWIIDEFGNAEFCEVEVEIQDDNTSNACDGFTGEGDILGLIATTDDENVEDVEVALLGSGTEFAMTGENGLFAFPDMPFGGSYSVEPFKNDDAMNGVSTADILMIQRHLLGLEPLETAYEYIAADANNSQDVSALDIVAIRNLLLGVHADFPNNTSWRFVDKQYEFPAADNPWFEEFPEQYSIDPFEENMMEVDFVAIKVGDINGNAEVNNLIGLEDRTDGQVVMNLKDVDVKAGTLVELPVRFFDAEDLRSYQFAMDFDKEYLAYLGHAAGQLELGKENFSDWKANDGTLRMIWYQEGSEVLSSESEIFTIKFMAMADGRLSDMISLNANVLPAEASLSNAEVHDIRLEFNTALEGEADVVLFQNRPNPFSYTTEISFMLDEAKNATLSILDVTGKVILAKTGYFDKGLNVVEIQADQLNAQGVLYYRLETTDFMDMKKMILIK